MAEFLMTQQGYEEAVKKLEYLRKVKREEIVQRIAEARSHGDLSENARVIEENADNSAVHFGSVVRVHDVDFDEDVEYTIMGTTEADPMKNIISNESPVGAALMGRKVGDTVTVQAPNGEYKLKILKIN